MKKAPIDALVNPYAKASTSWTATAPKQAPPTQGMLPSASSFFAPTKRASSSISKKKEALTDSADKAANRQSALKEYVKTLVKGIPKIDSEGYFYFTEGTGYQSIQNRQRLKGGNLKKIVSSIFPSSHIHRVSSPRDRAKALKGNLEWNPELRHKAQGCFQVPSDCNICLVWPDLFERDLLKNEEGYATESNGVLTPCPYCGTNKHVEQNKRLTI